MNVGESDRLGDPIPLQAKAEGNPMTDTDGEILTLEKVAAYLRAGKRAVCRVARELPAACGAGQP